MDRVDHVETAGKRGYESMTVAPSSRVTVACRGVGPLADAVYSQAISSGGRIYYVPEGTALGVSVIHVSSGWGESCVTGSMGLKGWSGDNLYVFSPLRGYALFNPEGMGVVYPGACCCEWGGGCLCDIYGMFTTYVHSFHGGHGGRMHASPGILDNQYAPYLTRTSVTRAAGDEPFGHEVRFRVETHPGYQHVRTLVFSEEGQLVDIVVPPLLGGNNTTVVNRSISPVRAVAETVQQPTLKVDLEVEGKIVDPAVAGHYTFDNINYAGGRSTTPPKSITPSRISTSPPS